MGLERCREITVLNAAEGKLRFHRVFQHSSGAFPGSHTALSAHDDSKEDRTINAHFYCFNRLFLA